MIQTVVDFNQILESFPLTGMETRSRSAFTFLQKSFWNLFPSRGWKLRSSAGRSMLESAILLESFPLTGMETCSYHVLE